MKSTEEFFETPLEQSKVKATIVSKYFDAWANVITAMVKRRGRKKVGYIDLFCGPGEYDDGSQSTPVKVLEKALKNADLKVMLHAFFNDKEEEYVESLKTVIGSMEGIDALKSRIFFNNEEVGKELVEKFEQMSFMPSLIFADPCGYKGLTLRLLNAVTKDWGCDCIFFFNYRRINPGLDNPKFKENMDAIFGEDRADQLREKLKPLNPSERESEIIEEISQALISIGCRYVLPFCFKTESGARTSHYLVLATKHFRGYEIMKDIMAKESSDAPQGVPSLEYNPATEKQPFLFGFVRPLDELGKMLLDFYAGRTCTMREIYEEHSVGNSFLSSNYKTVLGKLESEGKITTDPPAEDRPKRKGKVTFANHVKVTFPKKES